jgi:hypothetical protein
MALVVSDYQFNLALRLGESSAPNDSTTKAIRLEFLNMGYLKVAKARNWWWLESTSTTNTNTGSTTGYSEPTDCKKIIELKINNIFYDEIPYKDNRIYMNTLGVVTLPSLRRSYKYYRYGGKYFLVPVDGADGATHNIKYYKRVSKATSDNDTFLIPDEYEEIITSYAEARYWMSITQQAKAVVPLQEFDDALRDMSVEQGKRTTGSVGFGIHDPEDLAYVTEE